MAKDKKKEEKFLSKYSTMSTGELLNVLESYHGDTDAARLKQDEEHVELSALSREFDNVEAKYLVGKRGEHAKYKSNPKTYRITNHEEAEELINHLSIEGIKHELGDKFVSHYKSDPERIKSFLASKGIDFHKLKEDLLKNKRNIKKSELYGQLKQALVSSSIDDIVERQNVQRYLASDTRHYDGLVGATNPYLKNHGLQLEKNLEQGKILQHYVTGVSGNLNKEYISNIEGHFKKLPKPKKK